MREPRVAHTSGRGALRRLRREVLEDLEVRVTLSKHDLTRRGAVKCGEPVRDDGVVRPREVENDLEAELVPVEREQSLDVVGRDRDMMQPADHDSAPTVAGPRPPPFPTSW